MDGGNQGPTVRVEVPWNTSYSEGMHPWAIFCSLLDMVIAEARRRVTFQRGSVEMSGKHFRWEPTTDGMHTCNGLAVLSVELQDITMENQHRHIKGYRELSPEEIHKMNLVKHHGLHLGELIEQLRSMPEVDQRWVSIGETHLQQGLMALTRAIAKPEFF